MHFVLKLVNNNFRAKTNKCLKATIKGIHFGVSVINNGNNGQCNNRLIISHPV